VAESTEKIKGLGRKIKAHPIRQLADFPKGRAFEMVKIKLIK
jgi:hypothetical protein